MTKVLANEKEKNLHFIIQIICFYQVKEKNLISLSKDFTIIIRSNLIFLLYLKFYAFFNI